MKVMSASERGRPVVLVAPAQQGDGDELPQQRIMGTIEAVGDIVAPAVPAETWNGVPTRKVRLQQG